MDTVEKNSNVSPDARRAQIIAISTKVFLDKGFSGTSMSDLAAANGIKKASFYHHFRSKDALFIACVISGYAPAIAELERLSQAQDISARDQLRHGLDTLYEITVRSDVGRLSPLLAEVSRQMPDLATQFFDEYIALQRKTLRTIIEGGVASGEFKRPDYDVLYHLVFGPIVTLSLSREMFAGLGDLDRAFPMDKLADGHFDAIMGLLR